MGDIDAAQPGVGIRADPDRARFGVEDGVRAGKEGVVRRKQAEAQSGGLEAKEDEVGRG